MVSMVVDSRGLVTVSHASRKQWSSTHQRASSMNTARITRARQPMHSKFASRLKESTGRIHRTSHTSLLSKTKDSWIKPIKIRWVNRTRCSWIMLNNKWWWCMLTRSFRITIQPQTQLLAQKQYHNSSVLSKQGNQSFWPATRRGHLPTCRQAIYSPTTWYRLGRRSTAKASSMAASRGRAIIRKSVIRRLTFTHRHRGQLPDCHLHRVCNSRCQERQIMLCCKSRCIFRCCNKRWWRMVRIMWCSLNNNSNS